MEDQLAQLPKVELHCHLDGSVSFDFLQGLFTREKEELRKEVVAPSLCHDLGEYLSCFPLLTSALSSEIRLIEAVLDVAQQAAKENILYLELRFSPFYVATDSMNEEQAIQAVLRGIELAKAAYGIIIGLILCMMRGKDNQSIFVLSRKYRDKGVCALDLAGNEAKYGFPESDMKLLKRAKLEGIPFTIHAGETGNVENVLIATKLGAKRIGHGIAAAESKIVCEYLQQKEICLELCPTCNIQTRASASWQSYPLVLFNRRQVRLSINTDNRTVSDTTLTQELLRVQQQFQLSIEQLVQFNKNALQSAFLPQQQKQLLLLKMNNELERMGVVV